MSRKPAGGPLKALLAGGAGAKRGSAAKGTTLRANDGSAFAQCPICQASGACTYVSCGKQRAAQASLTCCAPLLARCSLAVALTLMDMHLEANCEPDAKRVRRVEAEPSAPADKDADPLPARADAAEPLAVVTATPMVLRWRDDAAPRASKYGRACGASAKLPLPDALARTSKLPGHFLLEDFLSEAEEAELLAAVESDASPKWQASTLNGRSRGKAWGVQMSLGGRGSKGTVAPGTVPFPEWLGFLVQRVRARVHFLRGWSPNHVNAIWYDRARGDYLSAHVDDRQLSGDIILNVSLAGACTMTYAPMGKAAPGAAPVRVHLPRRCVQVQSGEARYQWTHAIAADDLEEPRRVSLTLRESPLTTDKLQGGKRGTL